MFSSRETFDNKQQPKTTSCLHLTHPWCWNFFLTLSGGPLLSIFNFFLAKDDNCEDEDAAPDVDDEWVLLLDDDSMTEWLLFLNCSFEEWWWEEEEEWWEDEEEEAFSWL